MNITARTWQKPKEYVEAGKGFAEAGILDAHRFFYIFFSYNDIDDFKNNRLDPKAIYYGKAIQINLSISKGGKDNVDVAPWFRGSDNSTFMSIGMYIYDVISEGSITDLSGAQFILKESLVSSTTNDYDLKKSMLLGASMYSKDLRDKPEKSIYLANNIMEDHPPIPEPEYYTIRQQEVENGDIFTILDLGTVITRLGHEIFDENTTFSIMDMTEMNAMEPILKNKIYEARNTKRMSDYKASIYDSTELSEYTLYEDFASMQHGYTYIYDTNLGVNIIKNNKSFMPFVNHQFKDKLQEDLEGTLRKIKMYASEVENELGPMRLMFTPLYYGDKSNVYFKDWKADNQPVVKDSIGLDSGTKLENEVVNCCSEEYDGWGARDKMVPPDGGLYD